MFTSIILFFLSLTNSYALTNSTPAESPRFDSVVFINSSAPDASGDTTPGYCNATLLNSHVLITAAHCAILAYVSNDTKMTIEVGSYFYKNNPDGTRKRIGYKTNSTIVEDVHIEFTTNLKNAIARRGEKATIDPQDDIALLWWDHETPETVGLPYAELLSQTEYQSIMQNIQATPFSVVSINPFAEVQTLNTRKIASLDSIKWTWSNYLESKSNSRVEEGDSGSPLFVTSNGKFKLFGVVKGRASTVFSNWDVFASANLKICQLSSNLPADFKKNFCY